MGVPGLCKSAKGGAMVDRRSLEDPSPALTSSVACVVSGSYGDSSVYDMRSEACERAAESACARRSSEATLLLIAIASLKICPDMELGDASHSQSSGELSLSVNEKALSSSRSTFHVHARSTGGVVAMAFSEELRALGEKK